MHEGSWQVRCSCGWEAVSDHETHVWQLARQHEYDHWADDPPAYSWSYTCQERCGWLSGWHGIKSELAAAVRHHRQRAAQLGRWRGDPHYRTGGAQPDTSMG